MGLSKNYKTFGDCVFDDCTTNPHGHCSPNCVLGNVRCVLLLGRKQHSVYDVLQTLPVFPEKGQKTDS